MEVKDFYILINMGMPENVEIKVDEYYYMYYPIRFSDLLIYKHIC